MFFVKWIFRVLPVAYMVAVWIMSSMPSNAVVELPVLSVDRFIKESLHLVEFAILYWLLVAAWLTADGVGGGQTRLEHDRGQGRGHGLKEHGHGQGRGHGLKEHGHGRFTARVSLILVLVAGSYGIVDELHQSFVPYRSATVIDAVKDWTGVLVSWYLVRIAYFGDGTRLVKLRKLLMRFERLFDRARG